MTDGERRLWSELRQFRRWYGIHVRRQAPIGTYIADFVVHDHKLVVEVDGERHLDPERQIRDRERDNWLAGQGYKVLRFSTGELAVAFEGCVQEILWALGLMEGRSAPPSFGLSPEGRGGAGVGADRAGRP